MNKAIIVGIDAYPENPLYGCVNDAQDVASCLSLEQYDFDNKTLYNGQATRSNVLQPLSEAAYGGEGGETLLFYFAGHGEALGQAGHLVTYDAQNFDPGISLSHLAQIMESASSKFSHVIAILDCCHSGSAFSWTNSRPLQPGDIEREVPAVNESRCILAACRPEEPSIEIEGHGVFTSALTDALLGAAVNWDGDITLLGIYEYLAGAIKPELQKPVFKGDIAGTVVIGRGFPPREGPPIDKSELTETLSKAHQLVDQYHYLALSELTERNVRLEQGAKKCAHSLESIISWFNETERALPDLRRNRDWGTLTARVREHQKNLADISPEENTRFGRVVKHLGHGGYGHVWEIEGQNGESYAFKVFHGNELDDEVKVQRFTNGYNNMRKLQHPHIVRVHEMTQAPFGFLMDAIPGDNLRKAFIDKSDPESVIRLIIDICETVQHAHAQQVKHRDIKPENIIGEYQEDGRLVPHLTDFDLAYHETNRTVTGNIGVGGVINYAAPEQLYEPNAKTARIETVDVFSLAQLMFFIVTGKDPSGEDFSKNTQSLTRELHSWIDDRAAKALITLYATATSKDPAARPQRVIEFVDVLRQAESVIQMASGTDKIDEEDFCRRIGQLYANIDEYHATEAKCRMSSRSGQVEVLVTKLGVKTSGVTSLEIECSVIHALPVPSLKTGHAARQSINARLDKSIGNIPGVSRHSGTKGAYQVFLVMRDVPFDVTGINRVTQVISKAVDAIEQWG
ncbi:protein kinase domain-containing protein [Streptomyces torulosus]|uniref:protein kinase domain-containing protein n=1 Tax=Streptomyces torulosus TaxID=68276 RepID=UPI000A56EECC|nr:caspase family protein [Streptomyces torulosus]